MKKAPLFSFRYFFYDFIRLTGWPLLLFFRPKKIYVSSEAKTGFKGGFILMANHNSMKDPFYLICCLFRRRHHFVTTNEVCSTKWKRFLFKTCFLCIEINRESFSMSSFKEITSNLEKGNMVSMFPEGHINVEQEELNQFKGGIVMMAFKANVPIRPVYLEKRKHWYSRLRLYVGKEFDVKEYLNGRGLNTNTVKEVAKELQNKEKELEILCSKGQKRA
ncbi:MAG: 1-acyl-sn-glycerol-3-phosphate acyltransferase [Bacilli bacterium]|nr:1-acyl-sn-glycerol-3-phosphate acyltransferase [Bacilli bacterium]